MTEHEQREVQGPGRRCAASQVDGTTTDQRLLDSRGPTDWVHTDPWRVLRIQAEFVEGFGALAELGPAIACLRLGPHPARRPDVRQAASRSAARWSTAGFAVITGGGPGAMEAANKGASEAGGIERRPRHRAALRVRPQPVGRHRHQLPLLLRPQDDVREVRPGLRRAARRPRHPRRAVRGADPGADPEGHRRSRIVLLGTRLLARPARLAARHGARRTARSTRPTSTCCTSPTTSTRPSR